MPPLPQQRCLATNCNRLQCACWIVIRKGQEAHIERADGIAIGMRLTGLTYTIGASQSR